MTNKKGYDPLMMRITIESQRTELVTKIELFIPAMVTPHSGHGNPP